MRKKKFSAESPEVMKEVEGVAENLDKAGGADNLAEAEKMFAQLVQWCVPTHTIVASERLVARAPSHPVLSPPGLQVDEEVRRERSAHAHRA